MRITKVGLWFVVFTLITGLAATNTGNNALYMTLAALLGTGAMAAIIGFGNVRLLDLEIEEREEIYARVPSSVELTLRQKGHFPAWLVLLQLDGKGQPTVISRIGGRGRADGVQRRKKEVLFTERGRHRIESVTVSSLYPLGFFRVSKRIPAASELIVFPELFDAASLRLRDRGPYGDDAFDRPGRGQDLHSLRDFNPGDDPRHMHWKQTARTKRLILQERQIEECRRLSVVLDNALPDGRDAATASARFEQLVSEAATAAVDYLERGYEVQLITRETRVEFGAGSSQKLAILESLALVRTSEANAHAIESGLLGSPQLHFSLGGPDAGQWGATA